MHPKLDTDWMDDLPLRTRSELLPGGLLHIAFVGAQGGDSDSERQQARRMGEAIRQAVADHRPTGLVIDLGDFGYTTGNWICPPLLEAHKAVRRPGHTVMILIPGAKTLADLWTTARLDQIIPLAGNLQEAQSLLSRSAASGDGA